MSETERDAIETRINELWQYLDHEDHEYRAIFDEVLTARSTAQAENERLREAIQNGLDMLDVEHFPWCKSLDANARPQLACDCGRNALSTQENSE